MEMTSAQGQDATRKIRARWSHMVKGPAPKMGGSTVRRTAIPTTMGVYHLEKRVMKRSVLLFC